MTKRDATTSTGTGTRRRRGTPRRLLLESASDLFSRQGYGATSTREIAEHAGVSETLLFRCFGSKAALFREAVAVPFIEVVESFKTKWESGFPDELDEEMIARRSIADLFDLFRKNRALVVMLWAAQTPHADLRESGVFDEVNDALQVLVDISATEASRRRGTPLPKHDVATRTTIAMIAGMAVFGTPFYGRRPPARKDIVEELTQATLRGHLYRPR
jgi:AcrR family transcriptional regulator